MSIHVAPPRSAAPSGRVFAALAALAVAFLAAFVIAPPALTGLGDQGRLTETVRDAFVEYWGTGERDFTPGLERIVGTWFWYHVTKAVTAALLLAVLVALGAGLWKAFLRGAGRRAVVTSAGAVVTVLALCALALVMANVQGAAAPFASLLPMLVDGGAPDGGLAGTLEQVRQRLADDPARPGLDVMVSGFAHYHAVMAMIAGAVAVALLGVSVLTWRRFARTEDRRTRRAVASFGALMVLSTLAVSVVAVANTTVAADPVQPLAAFFAGGW